MMMSSKDDAGGSTRVHMWGCSIANANQHFVWDSVTKLLHSNKGGTCLNAPTGARLNSGVALEPCDASLSSMLWDMSMKHYFTGVYPTLERKP